MSAQEPSVLCGVYQRCHHGTHDVGITYIVCQQATLKLSCVGVWDGLGGGACPGTRAANVVTKVTSVTNVTAVTTLAG